MSLLVCSETGLGIDCHDVLMVGRRNDVHFYPALSQEALRRIPESERRPTPCEPGDGGVNIHEASSSPNIDGRYGLFDFQLGKFFFSVSQETAEKYLPKLLKRYSAPVHA